MQEFECVRYSDGAGLGDCFDASVVVECWCEVPSAYGMITPGLASGRLDVNHDFGSDWSHGSAIE